MFRPKGILASMVTSFTQDGRIHEDGLKKNIEFVHAHGIQSAVILGGTGEPMSMTFEERKRVMEVCIEAAKGKLHLVVGALAGNPDDVSRDIETAAQTGAQGCMITSPPFVRPSENDVYRFLTKVSVKSRLPLIVFNVPSRTGFLLSVKLVCRVAKEIDMIVGIKESSRDMVQFSDIRGGCSSAFSVLQGVDSLFLPSLALGGDGGILAAAAAFPEICLDIEENVKKGDLLKAQESHYRLMDLVHVMYEASHPLPLKYAIEARGIPVGPARPPFYGLSDDHVGRVKKVVEDLKQICSMEPHKLGTF